MGQNSGKEMTNNTSAYFNGTQNCGQGKISLNGLNKQNSLNDVDKSNRFSGRRKKEKKHSKSSDSQHQHMLDNSRIIGMKLAEGNYVVPNGRVVQNGNITYRNIMKDSASENEDVEHVPRSLSRNGSRSFREHSGSESVRNSAINIRPSFHSSGTLSNGCHGNTSPSYRGFDGDYETIGNMDTVSRKYEAFVARLRAETETSSKKLSNPQETERSKEAFMDMLASRYPQYAEKISTTASEDGFPLRSGRSRDHHRRSTTLGYTQPGRPADYEGTMSEMDGPTFHRGGFVRSSLPATRSPPSVDKPPGLAFLIFRDETKKALLPNEITHLDTVRALFVRSFPGKLTMSFLESPKRKIYILEPRTNIYYQLEDLRDIRDRTVLRVHECDSMEPQRVNEKPEVRGRTVQVPASSVHGYYGAGPASAITSQVQKAQTLPAYMHQPIYMSHDDITQSPARTAYERSRSLTPDPVRTASYAQNPIYGRMGISPERPPPPSQDRIGPPDRQIGLRPIPENAQMLNGYGVKNGMGYDYTDISQGSHKQYVRQAMSPPAVSSVPRMDTGRRAFSPPPNLQNYDYIQVVPASQMGPTYMAKGVRASTMVTPQRATGAPPTSVTSTVSQVTTPTLPPSSQGQQQTSWRERSPVGRPPTALSTVPYSTSSSHHQQQQQQQQRSQSYRVPISNEREPVSSLRPRSMTPSPMDNYENDFTRNRIDKMEHQLANLAAWVQTAVIHSNTGAPSSVKGPSGPSSLTSEPSPLGAMPDSASGRVEGYEKEQPLYQGLSDLGSEGTVALSHDMKMNILSIKHQADALRLDLHSLRRLQQINKESIIETVDDAWKKIRDAMSSVPGAENIIIRQQRNEVDTMYQIYLEDKHLAEKELSDLEQAVEELRSDVLSRQCRVQMSDVEGMALILSHVTKQLGDLKARFPKLQERLKHVMAAEMEVIVREEKWLKDEPERLDNSLKKCKKLTGTLFTLKRLASVQEHRPPQTVSLSARARIPTLEDKKAVLENIQAMVPNHEARVQGIQAAENARMIKKKITTQQESLRFGKSLELATKALKPHGAPSSQPVGTTVSSCQLLSTATMGDTSSIISFVMPMSTSTPKSASQQATSKPESSATSPSIAYPVMSLIKTVSSGSEQMSARDFLYHDDPHAKVQERREQRLDGRSSKGLSSDPAVLPVTSTETTTHKRQIGRKGERAEKERAKQIDLTTQKTAARAAFFSSLSSPPTPTTSTSPITTGGSLSVDSPTEYGKGSSATGPQSKSVPSTVQTSKSAFSSSAVTQPHYGVSQISSLPSSALKPSSLPVSGSSIISSQRFSPASPSCYASTQTSSSQPRTTFTAIPKPYSPTKSRSSPLTPESPKYQIPPSQQGLVPQGRPHPFSLSGEDSQKESELSGARPKKVPPPPPPRKSSKLPGSAVLAVKEATINGSLPKPKTKHSDGHISKPSVTFASSTKSDSEVIRPPKQFASNIDFDTKVERKSSVGSLKQFSTPLLESKRDKLEIKGEQPQEPVKKVSASNLDSEAVPKEIEKDLSEIEFESEISKHESSRKVIDGKVTNISDDKSDQTLCKSLGSYSSSSSIDSQKDLWLKRKDEVSEESSSLTQSADETISQSTELNSRIDQSVSFDEQDVQRKKVGPPPPERRSSLTTKPKTEELSDLEQFAAEKKTKEKVIDRLV